MQTPLRPKTAATRPCFRGTYRDNAADAAGDASDWAAILRSFALVIGAAHVVAAILAASSLVMLHGDGSWFVYALSVQDPWDLKWRSIAARSTIYLTTVVPTDLIAHTFDLLPLQIARVNALIFFGLPGLLYAFAARLVWRERPLLLSFLIIQALAGVAICYGFPTEIILAPGFLWVALFGLHCRGGLSALSLAAYTALIFTHELAFPAAMVFAAYGWWLESRNGGASSALRGVGTGILLALPVIAMFAVRLSGGGEGSDANAIYVIDPRRVLNNPTLWLVTLLVPITYLAARRWISLQSGKALWLVAGAAALSCYAIGVLVPALNFADGRYDGRSLIALGMFVLSAAFVVHVIATEHKNGHGGLAAKAFAIVTPRSLALTLPCASAAAGIMAASALLFLSDWSRSLNGMSRLSAPVESPQEMAIMPAEQALALMPEDEALATRRMGFPWIYPFRSFLLADGHVPGIVMVDERTDYRWYCNLLAQSSSSLHPYPPAAHDRFNAFVCSHSAPEPPETASQRFFRRLRTFFD